MARKRSRPSSAPEKRSIWRRIVRWGLGAGALVLFGLMCAVGFAYSSLPQFGELRTRETLGQVIRVRSADGQIILSLGPIYGEWIGYRDIPRVMVDAMVSVEDRRFRMHPGVDPIGLARAVQVRIEVANGKRPTDQRHVQRREQRPRAPAQRLPTHGTPCDEDLARQREARHPFAANAGRGDPAQLGVRNRLARAARGVGDQQLCDAEIEESDFVRGGDHHVAGLQIAMHNARLRMRVAQPLGDLSQPWRDLQHLAPRRFR